ncbi:NFATC2-interacting protein isoform X3 [Engraulis encrasicolus]|uniref:NFATC2-interacting protein isoform X3 n=1 Tax=Engraulis encrasicolus TaxID=184585 RepID=UPI002FD48C31
MATLISDSDSDGERSRVPSKPRPKRRRILDPSAITAVNIYSNKVDSGLKLQPEPFEPEGFPEPETPSPQVVVQRKSPRRANVSMCIELSDDSDEETTKPTQNPTVRTVLRRSPSPPPSPSTPLKARRRPNRKLAEMNKKLDVLGSLLRPSPERPGLALAASQLEEEEEDDGEESDDADIAIVDRPRPRKKSSQSKRSQQQENTPARLVNLKIRHRADIHRIQVAQTALLKHAVEELSLKLKVPPSSLLLLHGEAELNTSNTIGQLGLGIADIIDCVVLSEEVRDDEDGSRADGCREGQQQADDVITVRLQGKEKGSDKEYTVHKREPLGSILSRYTSALPPAVQKKTRFLFDGAKVIPSNTPFDLDMEDGDVIEVWS